jgi:toxin ParE1/3/4
MLNVLWLDEALRDLAEINSYISDRNPVAARNLNKLIVEQTDLFSEHPLLFRAGRIPGTRELVVHPNYIVVYRLTAATVEILNVLHVRQEYP